MNAIKQLIPHCLKIRKKVSFNTASEASYVYIMSGQKKLIKNAKIEKFKCDIMSHFKTLCNSKELSLLHSFIYTGFTVRGDGYQWSAD